MNIDSKTRARYVLTVAVVALLSAGGAALHVPSSGAATARVQLTLVANVAPVPNFDVSGFGRVGADGALTFANPCVGVDQSGTPVFLINDRSPACTQYVLRAIDRARRLEGVPPMVLPTNWYRLSTPQQLFVVVNLERVDRGLAPYVGLNAALDTSAQRAALAFRDPANATGFAMSAMGSTWASAGSVLEADFSWLYNDGWGGSAAQTPNYDCTSAVATTCWGHRKILLGTYTGLGCRTCELGTGYVAAHGTSSYTVLVERPLARPPYTSFSWARNVVPFLEHGTLTTASVPIAANSPLPTSTHP